MLGCYQGGYGKGLVLADISLVDYGSMIDMRAQRKRCTRSKGGVWLVGIIKMEFCDFSWSYWLVDGISSILLHQVLPSFFPSRIVLRCTQDSDALSSPNECVQ